MNVKVVDKNYRGTAGPLDKTGTDIPGRYGQIPTLLTRAYPLYRALTVRRTSSPPNSWSAYLHR